MLNLHSMFTNANIEFRLFQFAEPTAESKGGLHAGRIKAYVQLCLALNQMAKTVKTASPKPMQMENPKYAMFYDENSIMYRKSSNSPYYQQI